MLANLQRFRRVLSSRTSRWQGLTFVLNSTSRSRAHRNGGGPPPASTDDGGFSHRAMADKKSNARRVEFMQQVPGKKVKRSKKIKTRSGKPFL
jgi:hypothetical protein